MVVSLKSRSIEASHAVEAFARAEKWLRGRGADHVLFKICSTFDSTDAGNIGPVMDALRANSGDAIVLVTPAFPETGRTVYQGNLFVGAVPLNESPLKDHPLNPMHDSNLVRVLARQSRTKVGLVDLATLSRGADAVRAVAPNSQARHRRRCIDAVFDRDLETIGGVALEHRLSVGASGIGLGLPRAGRRRQGQMQLRPRRPARPSADRRRAWPEAARRRRWRQIGNAEKAMAVLHLDPEQIVAGPGEVQRALAWASGRISGGPILIASPARRRTRLLQLCNLVMAAMQQGMPLSRRWPTSRKVWCSSGVRRLVVAGGETSGAVVDRLRIPGFLVGAEIAAGVPVLRAVGADQGEDAACPEIGQFRRPGVFLRCAEADALIASRIYFRAHTVERP